MIFSLDATICENCWDGMRSGMQQEIRLVAGIYSAHYNEDRYLIQA